MPAKTRKSTKATKAAPAVTPTEPAITSVESTEPVAPTESTEPAAAAESVAPAPEAGGTQQKVPTLRRIPVDRIDPDPNQPRKEFTEDELNELAASMRNLGQLQPVIVRVNPDDPKRFLLVVGERRWRAAKLAGLPTLNATVTKLNSVAAFIAQVAENVNRKDMTPMEEAAAYAKLAAVDWETDKIAKLFGKSPAYVGWRIDLLTLVPAAQEAVNKRILPINTAWYVCKLAPETQQVFLKKWADGDFPSARDAEAFARARKAVEDQAPLFTPTPEATMSPEEKEKVRQDRRKLVSDFDRLSIVGELLLTLSGAEPAELAKLLAGASGGVGAYLTRVEHLAQVAGKVAGVLRKAQAIAAATSLTLDFEQPDLAAEVSDEATSPAGEAAGTPESQPEAEATPAESDESAEDPGRPVEGGEELTEE